jgi:TRAP-type C4-dicarboxylate transport system permease small subunit
LNLLKQIVDKILNNAVITLMSIILIVASAQVFWRYVLNNPLDWSEELARFLFIWLVFLASSVALREKKHMCIDFSWSFLPPWARKIRELLVQAIIAVFLLVILIVAPEIITLTWDQLSPSLSIPMAYVYLAFPVMAFLMLIYKLFEIIQQLQDKP